MSSDAASARSADAAYVFAIFGKTCGVQHQLALLAAIGTLRQTRPAFDVVVMVAGACAVDGLLMRHLRLLRTRSVQVPIIDGVRCTNVDASKERWSASYTIANVWNMTEYRAALLLDSDLAVTRNLDHLLER